MEIPCISGECSKMLRCTRTPQRCLLVGFRYRSTFIKHPCGGPGIFVCFFYFFGQELHDEPAGSFEEEPASSSTQQLEEQGIRPFVFLPYIITHLYDRSLLLCDCSQLNQSCKVTVKCWVGNRKVLENS